MIIDSLLDTDLYKFTMMQVVLHHFPGAQVEYQFRCRTEGAELHPALARQCSLWQMQYSRLRQAPDTRLSVSSLP